MTSILKLIGIFLTSIYNEQLKTVGVSNYHVSAHIDSGDEDEDSGEEEGTSKSKDEDENEEEWTSNADTKLDATEDEETDVQSTA